MNRFLSFISLSFVLVVACVPGLAADDGDRSLAKTADEVSRALRQHKEGASQKGTARSGLSGVTAPVDPKAASLRPAAVTVVPGELYYAWAHCTGGGSTNTWDVCFFARIAGTPGHLHEKGRPEIKIYDPVCRYKLPARAAVSWYWRAPDFASELDFKISFSGACGQVEHPSKADARINGLTRLEPRDGLRPALESPTHPDAHYGTARTLKSLSRIADRYKLEFPSDPDLVIGDMSLPWGGLFDRDAAWQPPYDGHRLGTDVDIHRDSIPESHRARFQEILKEERARWSVEGEFYHVDLSSASPTRAAR